MRIAIELAEGIVQPVEYLSQILQQAGWASVAVFPSFEVSDPDMRRFLTLRLSADLDQESVEQVLETLRSAHGVVSAVPEPDAEI